MNDDILKNPDKYRHFPYGELGVRSYMLNTELHRWDASYAQGYEKQDQVKTFLFRMLKNYPEAEVNKFYQFSMINFSGFLEQSHVDKRAKAEKKEIVCHMAKISELLSELRKFDADIGEEAGRFLSVEEYQETLVKKKAWSLLIEETFPTNKSLGGAVVQENIKKAYSFETSLMAMEACALMLPEQLQEGAGRPLNNELYGLLFFNLIQGYETLLGGTVKKYRDSEFSLLIQGCFDELGISKSDMFPYLKKSLDSSINDFSYLTRRCESWLRWSNFWCKNNCPELGEKIPFRFHGVF